jgi:DNA mismatch repair protein MutH
MAGARFVAGLSLGELAAALGQATPVDLRRAKGFVGGLLERALGATAGSRAEPDFPELGVELKTLPVDPTGHSLESTFVCNAEVDDIKGVEWEHSRLWKKIRCVLWVPVEGTRSVPVHERRIGGAFLWQPNPEEQALLRADWELLVSLMARGEFDSLSGHLGRHLQLRPKGAKGTSRRRAFDEDGARSLEQPKGFYLRARFTEALLQQYLLGN